MNIFSLFGDMSHLFAIIILLLQLHKAKNARGISVKTQELWLLVFVTRYLDLFTTFYSIYNSLLKVIYVFATSFIIIKIKYTEPIKSLYNSNQDSFPHWKFAVFPCLVISFMIHVYGYGIERFSLAGWLWTFSISLEPLSIIPQLLLFQECKSVENLADKYIFLLAFYRVMYIMNWIYRANTENGYRHHWVVYFCAVLQTLLYVDFFYQDCRILKTYYHHFDLKQEKQKNGLEEAGVNVIEDDVETNDLIFEIFTPSEEVGDTTMTKRSNKFTSTTASVSIGTITNNSNESAKVPLLQPEEHP